VDVSDDKMTVEVGLKKSRKITEVHNGMTECSVYITLYHDENLVNLICYFQKVPNCRTGNSRSTYTNMTWCAMSIFHRVKN
jgi:hypothetical protein